MSARGTTLRRRRLALTTAVLWVLALEVMPWLHVAFHDRIAHHHHDATGAIIIDDTPLADADDLERDAPADDTAARILARSLAHGQHSAAHHDVAVVPPAAVITAPLPIDRRPITVAAIVSIEPISLAPGRAVARGPPLTPS
jgi:hypothetical protein